MTDTASTWRLIEDGPRTGAENMAIDEALLCSFDPVRSHPVLRLYGWQPPALSLGRFQKAAEVLDLERCRAGGVPIVRRITGGGTIYHADEVTYALVCSPDQIPPASSIKDSFRILTGFLIALYRDLGLEVSYALDAVSPDVRLGERTPFCFAGKESFDILVRGKKIGGNAQRRQKGIIFQHGSLPLVNRATLGLSFMKDRAPGLAEDAVSLEQCGIPPEYDVVRHKLIEAFQRNFTVELSPQPLTEQERSLAGELLVGRYGTDRWNLEGGDA
ncbi:lipoate--protein ligase family protein [Oryzomonas sagensis]|uniref:Lipoate--protein ligase family protein n=1 Tax=Oryzomonas sagensis TaxID=2603857 RepID=A0ABQ6TM35_9BACT|nr:lipoate--protein ligase family protein [Oryzomonas sagensis]KAB0669457.1 lipoate--protein ligase family protein [Oryzomonas sagensis]